MEREEMLWWKKYPIIKQLEANKGQTTSSRQNLLFNYKRTSASFAQTRFKIHSGFCLSRWNGEKRCKCCPIFYTDMEIKQQLKTLVKRKWFKLFLVFPQYWMRIHKQPKICKKTIYKRKMFRPVSNFLIKFIWKISNCFSKKKFFFMKTFCCYFKYKIKISPSQS